MKAPACAALLLAGGASRRMGFPKALIDFTGRPLWQVQAEKLEALGEGERFISLPHDLNLATGSWKIVRDGEAEIGPLAGLAAARQAMTAEWLIVLAIDLPRMDIGYLAELRDRAFRSGRGQVPQMDGYHLGLAAVYPRRFLDDFLADHLQGEDHSVQRFVRKGIEAGRLVSAPVTEAQREFFRNVNSPADLATAPRPIAD